jgi:hypothetical protein
MEFTFVTFQEGNSLQRRPALVEIKNGAFQDGTRSRRTGHPYIHHWIWCCYASTTWMFPFRAPRSIPARVIIHDPIESRWQDGRRAKRNDVRAAVSHSVPQRTNARWQTIDSHFARAKQFLLRRNCVVRASCLCRLLLSVMSTKHICCF